MVDNAVIIKATTSGERTKEDINRRTGTHDVNKVSLLDII